MLITAIEPRRKSLRALYLDGELAVNIDAQTLLSSRFQVGTEITDEELHELLAASDANRAKEKALYLIAHRDHSKKELVDKIRRTASQEAAEKAADRMEEIGLIDDRDYARRYASELFQRKYFARKRVEYELKQKGIDPDFIEELLEELNQRGEMVTFLGDGVPVFRELIAEKLQVPYSFAPAHVNKQRAAAVAALGSIYYKEGRTETAMEHIPEYLRVSQAERERAQKLQEEKASEKNS